MIDKKGEWRPDPGGPTDEWKQLGDDDRVEIDEVKNGTWEDEEYHVPEIDESTCKSAGIVAPGRRDNHVRL